MIQGRLFETANHIFKVDYFKKGKPKGKRSNKTHANTFLDVLYNFLLKELCEKVHGHDWWNLVLSDEDIVCNKENNVSANYSVIFRNENKVICEYEMEVFATRQEVINDSKAAPNQKNLMTTKFETINSLQIAPFVKSTIGMPAYTLPYFRFV